MEISHDLQEPLIKNEREEIDITSSLELVSKMKPVEFFYFREKNNQRKIGIKMEEKDVPLRYTIYKNKKKYLDADYINVILIDAIKKQNQIIEKLSNKIVDLEEKINLKTNTNRVGQIVNLL